MSANIIISKKNDIYLKVDCGDRGTAQELCDFFTFTVPGYQFMPSYKNKMWDGTIKLYNIYKQELYAGLEDYVQAFANERNYTLPFKTPLVPKNDILREEVEE